jgi:predicted RNase H-like HicB family nuclease
MVGAVKPTYTALAQRSGTWWAIRVAELPGIFSQARRLERVEYMARDAISLLLDIPPDSFEVEVREVLDPEADTLVADAIQARSDAIEHQRIAATKSRDAVRTLDRLGLPQRDIGRLLHLSHQRVAQLLASRGDG